MLFLNLPRELRDLIYNFILFPEHKTSKLRLKWPAQPVECDGVQDLALFLVCTSIRSEALPMYISRAIVYVDRSRDLEFLPRKPASKYIRAISLRPTPESCACEARFSSALASLPKLESLELRIMDARVLHSMCYQSNDLAFLADKFEHNRHVRWLMSMSGLSAFSIDWMVRCHESHYGPSCHYCRTWPDVCTAVEACLRSEVTQSKAPYGESPTHLARVAKQETRRQLFWSIEEQRLARERMEIQKD